MLGLNGSDKLPLSGLLIFWDYPCTDSPHHGSDNGLERLHAIENEAPPAAQEDPAATDDASTRGDGEICSPLADHGPSLFDVMPDELLELIIRRLPLASVVALSQCCSRLRYLVVILDSMWRQLYLAEFPRGRRELHGASWHAMFIRARSCQQFYLFQLC
eukprot:TRINITY_DN17287_c0_g1_i1.p1 TRINITY_DN17287_c0_g1~~TRINITY_DN17287_c0_g1_i1.p1  ORF type:complete len:160 (+),score=11.24 TRINITY_DN17287_c0_g1_i1:224-703(+)